MACLSLREAAQQTGTSKSTGSLRAIQAGRLSAPRNADGGYAIDPAELFRVYEPKAKDRAADSGEMGLANRPAGQDAPAALAAGPEELAVKMAALEAEIRGLKDLLAEVKQSRDE